MMGGGCGGGCVLGLLAMSLVASVALLPWLAEGFVGPAGRGGGGGSRGGESGNDSASFKAATPVIPKSTTNFHLVQQQQQQQRSVVEGNYNDSHLDLFWIRLLCDRLGRVSGLPVPPPEEISYDTFIQLAKGIQLSGATVELQRAMIADALESVLPPWFMAAGKLLAALTPKQISAELCAIMCGPMFKWLIGPTSVEFGTIVDSEGVEHTWKSTLKLEKCRYLEGSRCKGTCMNLCKVPSQSFFREKLGLDMTMEPDFDDMSCKFYFGAAPLSIEDDPLMKEPCYKDCPAAATTRALERDRAAAAAAAASQDDACKSMPM